MGQPQSAAESRQLAVHGRWRQRFPPLLDVLFDQGFIDIVKCGIRKRRVLKQPIQLFLIELDGTRFLGAADGNELHEPFGELLQGRDGLLLDDSNLALCK